MGKSALSFAVFLVASALVHDASATCRTVGGQAGVPYATNDWTSWSYFYDRVTLSSSATSNHYWQIPLAIDTASGGQVTVKFSANFGGGSSPCNTEVDFLTVQSDGTFFHETGYSASPNSGCGPSAAPNLAFGASSLTVPQNGTAMASFTVSPGGVVDDV